MTHVRQWKKVPKPQIRSPESTKTHKLESSVKRRSSDGFRTVIRLCRTCLQITRVIFKLQETRFEFLQSGHVVRNPLKVGEVLVVAFDVTIETFAILGKLASEVWNATQKQHDTTHSALTPPPLTSAHIRQWYDAYTTPLYSPIAHRIGQTFFLCYMLDAKDFTR
jgi:hypothetical protein